MAKRVRYLQGMGVPVGPGIEAGTVADVDDDEAARLIEGGIAEAADGATVSKKAETAEKATPKRGSRKATSKKAETAEKRGG